MAELGRPSLYKPEYCRDVVEHCKDGASLTSFAAEIGVCRDTISEWMKAHDDFSVAAKCAKARAAAWWEKAGRSTATTGEGNATLCMFGMKNMGGGDWADKQQFEHSGPDGGPISHVHAAEAEIKELFGGR